MDEIEIEHGYPPPRQRRIGITQTIRSMKFGSSVVLDKDDLKAWRQAANMISLSTRSKNLDDGRVRMWVVGKRKTRLRYM